MSNPLSFIFSMYPMLLIIYLIMQSKQGDPLSPLLFNYMIVYCIDGLIDAIKVDSLAVTHIAFADDIVVFSDTTESLQRQVELLSTRFSRMLVLS